MYDDLDQADPQVYRQELLDAIEHETTTGKMSQEDITDAVTRAIGDKHGMIPLHAITGMGSLTDMELEEVHSELQRTNMQMFRQEVVEDTEEKRLAWFSRYGFGEVPKDRRVQVSVYAADQRFGGPEEGGWWYYHNEFTGVSERVYPEDVEAARERLLAMFADDQPKRPIESAASDGPEFRVHTELKAGEFQTRGRPHYE